jgi:cobalamin synthase
MSEDFSIFHPRMRKPAVVSIVSGFALGILAVGAQRTFYDVEVSWILAVVLGVGATGALYGKMYVELQKQHGNEN